MISHLKAATHSRCKFFSYLPAIALIANYVAGNNKTPKPKFQIGDKVVYRFIDDDTISLHGSSELLTSNGIVSGIGYKLPCHDDIWSYFIVWDDDTEQEEKYWLSHSESELLEMQLEVY